MKIAYLGGKGTFGWRVVTRDNPGAEFVPYGSHSQVLQAVMRGEVQQGYVARENSHGGTVVDTVDPLIKNCGIVMSVEDGHVISRHGQLMVCGETILHIEQCLYGLGWPKVTQKTLQAYSHPQALTQCEEFLEKRYPGIEPIAVNSTIAGVEKLREDKEAIAIAPPWASEFYPGIPLLERGIQDSPVNETRFLVVGKEDCPPTGRDRTPIMFMVPEDEEEKPGSFDRVSQVFASCLVNKRLVESRPAKTLLGRYVFLIDVDGHRLDHVLRLIFELIVTARIVTRLQVFGSYPRWNGKDEQTALDNCSR